jgi:signal transduction histidine kinase
LAYVSRLATASSQRDIGEAFSSIGVAAAAAQRGELHLVAPPASLRLLTAAGAGDEAVVPCGVLSASAPMPVAEAFRTGEPVWLRSPREIEMRFPSIADLASATFEQARAAIPLMDGGKPFGVVALQFGAEQEFDERQRAMLSAIAELTARALRRALREEDERSTRAFQHRLIGIAGHELRNPLTVVLSVAEQLARSAADDREKRAAGRLLRNARRMERVVRDLVDYAHAEAEGGLAVAPKPTDFHEVCVRVLSSLASLQPGRKVIYERGDDGRGSWDPDRLEELLENLLVNAIKYGAPDRPVRVSWWGDDDELVAEVHNHGPPIAPSLLPHVFDPFERGKEHGSRDGLGLGLYVVKQIVVAHSGRVEIRSDHESGTTFIVHLPRAALSTAAGHLTA